MEFLGVTPCIRTPLTHIYHVIGGPSLQNSYLKQCEKFENGYLNCLEAHGFDKGISVCADFFEDLFECKFGAKEAWRIQKISEQHKKLYKEGKLKDRYYKLPEIDTFYPTHF